MNENGKESLKLKIRVDKTAREEPSLSIRREESTREQRDATPAAKSRKETLAKLKGQVARKRKNEALAAVQATKGPKIPRKDDVAATASAAPAPLPLSKPLKSFKIPKRADEPQKESPSQPPPPLPKEHGGGGGGGAGPRLPKPILKNAAYGRPIVPPPPLRRGGMGQAWAVRSGTPVNVNVNVNVNAPPQSSSAFPPKPILKGASTGVEAPECITIDDGPSSPDGIASPDSHPSIPTAAPAEIPTHHNTSKDSNDPPSPQLPALSIVDSAD